MLMKADGAISEPVGTAGDPQCAHGWNFHNCGKSTPPLEQSQVSKS